MPASVLFEIQDPSRCTLLSYLRCVGTLAAFVTLKAREGLRNKSTHRETQHSALVYTHKYRRVMYRSTSHP